MAWRPAQQVGDTGTDIGKAKVVLRKFSYGKALTDTTDTYTAEFGVALRQWQANIHYQVVFKGRPGPDVNLVGVFDWAVKKQMGLLDEPAGAVKPWIITVAGHLGAWDTGPAYLAARVLELEGLAQVQPVGYDNVALPFNNRSGANELHRIITEVVPAGAPTLITSHSQGGIITSDYLEQTLLPGKARGETPYTNFLGGVHWANPRRPMGVCASWVPDPPAADTEGLDPNCLKAKIAGVEEVARHKDLYAEKKRGQAAEYKEAVYLAAARGQFFGKGSLAEQIGELVTEFGHSVFDVFSAIADGVGFAVNMDPHNIFDLRPGIDHMRTLITERTPR